MTFIDYDQAPVPVDDRYAVAHDRYWRRLAQPGSWLSGAQGVAIAGEVRHAWNCQLCQDRKQALSPSHVDGSHDGPSDLPKDMVEVVHRVTTDPGRLTKAWYDGIVSSGLSPERYVETLATSVFVFSVDEFCRGIGSPLHPLPEPEAGDPSNYRPVSAEYEQAWVPMIPASKAQGKEADLWQRGQTGNVIRAMSLVPDEVRNLNDLNVAHYVPMQEFMRLSGKPYGTLTRMQMELIAGRVSVLNGCFY